MKNNNPNNWRCSNFLGKKLFKHQVQCRIQIKVCEIKKNQKKIRYKLNSSSFIDC